MPPHARLASFTTCVLMLMACAGAAPPPPVPPPIVGRAIPKAVSQPTPGARAALEASSMIGTPYRYGGSTPRGFDCSGLVAYSYQSAGIRGLPRSASDLEQRATPVSLDALQPGDLLFFRLGGAKTVHVAVYEGSRRFIHAPSIGKRVERVGFDDAYWGPRIRRAGRLLP